MFPEALNTCELFTNIRIAVKWYSFSIVIMITTLKGLWRKEGIPKPDQKNRPYINHKKKKKKDKENLQNCRLCSLGWPQN